MPSPLWYYSMISSCKPYTPSRFGSAGFCASIAGFGGKIGVSGAQKGLGLTVWDLGLGHTGLRQKSRLWL